MSSGEQHSDGAVVRRVLDGDGEAYGLLVQRYQDMLYRHAERMTGRSDVAADVVQQAFLRGYRNLDRCRNPGSVGGWLFRITSNLCKDYLKDRRRENVALEDAPALESGESNPAEDARVAELRGELDQALSSLTPEKREAFLLKHLEGRSYDEMSELLGVSVSALKMRVHRAREKLQDLLRDYDG